MNKEKKTQYFYFNNQEDKHFFAGLFNTAKNNFDFSLQELGRRINKKNTNKGFIKDAFNDTITDFDWNIRIDYLSESLVFVKYLKYKTRNEFRESLTLLYKTIDNYRNYYTHYHHSEIIIDSHNSKNHIDIKIFDLLDKLLFTSALTVKKQRAKSEEYKEYLSVKYKEDFKSIVQDANQKIDDYNTYQLAKGEKRRAFISKDPNKQVNYVLNFVFRNFIFNDKKNKKEILSTTASSKEKDKNKFSTYGFVLLLALFLNKKQTQTLLSYTKYLKDTRTLYHIITRWTFTFLCYKDISKFFKSNYTNDALLLQMISELTSCPNELYQHLSIKDKQEFIEDLNIYFKEQTSSNGNSFNALVSHEIIRKRYQNRFSYFAIRFLDEVIGFPSLRFHINLGKFNHDTRNKPLKGYKAVTKRSVLEKINVFTKLSTATKNKKEYFINSKDELLTQHWMEFPAPNYQFHKNSIGIWLQLDKKTGISDAVVKRKNDKDSKYRIAEKLNLVDVVKKPVAFLSFNELPSLLYSLLIDKKTPKEIENTIKNKIFKQKQLIRSFDKNSKGKNIPKKLKKAVYKEDIDWSRLLNSINTEIEKKPIENIRKNYKKMPNFPNEFSTSEKGKIASWLVDDIKRFTLKEIRKDWKGYQISTFQALLAFYDDKKEEIQLFIEKELLLNHKEEHLFKGLDFNKNTFFSFYKNYINKRKKYLKVLQKKVTLKNKDLDNDVFVVFKKRLYELKSETVQKKYFLNNNPVNLPRGFFDEKPTFINKEKDNSKFASWFTKSNVLENSQKYYHFQKEYHYKTKELRWDNRKRRKEEKTIDKTQIIKVNDGLTKQYYFDLPKETQKKIYKNEISIRNSMRQDFYILEMAKYLLGESTSNLTLKDVFLTKKQKNSIIEKSKSQNIKQKGDTGKIIINNSHILSKRIEFSIYNEKVKDLVALKHVGKFTKFEQDRRVQKIIKYFPEKTWTFIEIKEEIEAYEKVRNFHLFKYIHKKEDIIYNFANESKNLDALLDDKEKNPNFKKYISYHLIKNNDLKSIFNQLKIKKITVKNVIAPLKKVYLITKIRNTFSHNQLIPVDDFYYLLKEYPKDINEKIAEYLFRIFKLIFDKPMNN